MVALERAPLYLSATYLWSVGLEIRSVRAEHRLMHATNASLVLVGVQPEQAGEYSVEVANGVGSTASPEARLELALPRAG